MLDRKQALAELSNYLDEELSPEIRHALEKHPAKCHRRSLVYSTTRKSLKIVSESGALEVPLEMNARLRAKFGELLTGKQSRAETRGPG